MVYQSKKEINNSIFFKYSFSINSLKDDWLRINIKNTYLQYNYLDALEQNAFDSISFIYVIVYKNNKPIGVVYFQHIHVGSYFFTQKKLPSKILSKTVSRLLRIVNGNLLLCGNFFATGVNGFYFHEEVPNSTLEKITQQLKKETSSGKQIPKIKFVVMKEFWTNHELPLQQEFLKNYEPFKIDVNMILKIHKDWNSFDEYLSCMTSKYRTRAKSSISKTESLIVRELSSQDIKTHTNTIKDLYNSVLKTADFNITKLSPTSFYTLKTNLKENFIFTGYFINQKLIAFSTACLNNNHLDANYVGIDYSLNKLYPIYQRILYDYVKLAINKKVEELRLGRTAEIIKSSLGAVPQEMNLYIKHTNPILHTLFKPLTKYIHASKYEIRNPFKKDSH